MSVYLTIDLKQSICFLFINIHDITVSYSTSLCLLLHNIVNPENILSQINMLSFFWGQIWGLTTVLGRKLIGGQILEVRAELAGVNKNQNWKP